MPVRQYRVPEMSCQHCKSAIEASLAGVAGVETVDVDLGTLNVTVTGAASDEAVRAAIEEAGYEVAGVVAGS
jgi:copper chaperone CopZ